MRDMKPHQKKTIANASLLAAIAAATVWDFRLLEIRVFDGIAVLLFGIWLILAPEPIKGFFERRRRYWFLFATIGIYCIAGFLLHEHRSSLAILALAMVGLVLVGRTDWLKTAGPVLWVLVGVHAFFFAIQFIGFYCFGLVIDYQSIIGSEARILRAPTHMRVAGLFQEPNSYCLNLFFIASIAILWRPSRIGTFVAALTMFISESLWGIGAATLLLFLNEMRLHPSPRKIALSFGTVFVMVAIIFNGYLWITKNPTESIPFSYGRVIDILKDASLRERYLRNTCPYNDSHVISGPLTTRLMQNTFGNGLSTHYFTECLPANGFALLFKSFGVVGLAMLLAGLWFALRPLSVGSKLYAFLALGFAFTSYPLITYVIFWIWLPMLIRLLRLANEESVPAPVATVHCPPAATL